MHARVPLSCLLGSKVWSAFANAAWFVAVMEVICLRWFHVSCFGLHMPFFSFDT